MEEVKIRDPQSERSGIRDGSRGHKVSICGFSGTIKYVSQVVNKSSMYRLILSVIGLQKVQQSRQRK